MRESGGRIVLMDFGTGEELVGHQSARRHAALPGAGDLPRPARVGAERSLQPRRAAVLPGHRQVPRERRARWSSWRGRTRTASASRCATCGPTCPKRSCHRRARARQRSDAAVFRASASSSPRCGSRSMPRRAVPAVQSPCAPRAPAFGLAFLAAAAVLVALVAALIVWTGRPACRARRSRASPSCRSSIPRDRSSSESAMR